MNAGKAAFCAPLQEAAALAYWPTAEDSLAPRTELQDAVLIQSIDTERPQTWGNRVSLVVGSSKPGRRLITLLGWAIVVAGLMSTEFLFQPFVWRNFALTDIVPAWLAIARDRIVVAVTIAAFLAVAEASRRTGRWRFAPFVLAVIMGAALGEGLLSWLSPQEDRQDLASLAGRIFRWSLVGGAIAIMVELWRSGAELAAAGEEARIAEAQARRLAASSQLEMLRRQIEPHFLFNTLATIRRLHETDPDQGQHVLGRLFHYMSSTLGEAASRRSTLRDEIDLVLAYLDVCASRMTGRLLVHTEVEEGLRGLDFPPLILATLAENAIKHGVFPNTRGTVTISGGGGGLGLANIVERLRLLYGPTARFELKANVPRGVRAVVRIPVRQA